MYYRDNNGNKIDDRKIEITNKELLVTCYWLIVKGRLVESFRIKLF